MRLALTAAIMLALPLIEIAGFVVVGSRIGLWPTLGLVVASGLVGLTLLRRQGHRVLRRISAEERAGRVPARAMVDGAMIFFAGVLLLLPGFFTDIVGLLLFIAPVRAMIWSVIGRHVTFVYQGSPAARPRAGGGPVVDLDESDFERHKASPKPVTSPWRDGGES